MPGFFKAQALRALLVATVIWLSIVLSYTLSYRLSYGLSNRLIIVQSNALDIILINALSYVLISLALGSQKGDVHLTERLRWTRKGLFNSRHLSITLLLACITPIFTVLSNGLSNGLINGLSSELSDGYGNGVSKGLSLGLSLGLSYWFSLGVSQGISQEQIEDKNRHVVNQGIHRSWSSSIRIGTIGGVLIGAVGILSIVLSYGLSYILSWGILWGQFGGLSNELSNGWNNGQSYLPPMIISGIALIYLLTGGLAVWRHYVIRFLLWRSHTFPMLVPQFLDDVTARILLQRFGGGYRFTHRLLLDYFADLETATTLSANLSPTQILRP
jgi:hypothetical protein